eukprot:TRINITY_DN68103_c0_g1_i1.p1 TRINITY_DN68103_c0_g1~~TRINITY_DN68103_c0_g1_i1.p1  ORF type:complete len:363 (-),score=47.72 TRINITY_DN68103_c0_g1_i1:41-976(-)
MPTVEDYIFPSVPSSYDETHERLVRFPSGGEADVPAIFLPPVDFHFESGSPYRPKVCVIYFHPNACDIGDCLNEMTAIRDFVFTGDAAVLAPEYTGYGLLSDYQPSVASIDLVAMAAWRYCRRSLAYPAKKIVLWGRSVGTGPASALARSRARRSIHQAESRRVLHPFPPVGGLVLVAPFTSISEVVLHHSNSIIASLISPFWPVQDLVSDLALRDVPLCVVHPMEDEIVPLSHGMAVLKSAASEAKEGVWLPGISHNFSLESDHASGIQSFFKAQVCKDVENPASPVSKVLFDESSEAKAERKAFDAFFA